MSGYRARIDWKRDPADLGRAIAKTGERVKTHALVPYLERQAERLRGQMKQEAPWQDRRARRGGNCWLRSSRTRRKWRWYCRMACLTASTWNSQTAAVMPLSARRS
jgi:hypothetical protein